MNKIRFIYQGGTYDFPVGLNEQGASINVDAYREELTAAEAAIKHLRGKAEFDMPDEMRGRFHNGQCPDPCDMIDGPCACGATHNVKEWIGKLNKQLAAAEEREKQLRDALEYVNSYIQELDVYNDIVIYHNKFLQIGEIIEQALKEKP